MRLIKSAFMTLCLVLFCTNAMADEPRARQIMEAVDARDDGDNMISDLEMVLIDRHNKQRVRLMRSYKKDFGEDTYSLIFFQQPAEVRDTGFLSYDYDDSTRDDDQWLYLSALRKTKRIASGDKTGSFMGSDFSYADMTKRNLDDYDYRLLGEKEVRGRKVWLVESLPRTRSVVEKFGYTKSVLFVRQDNHVMVRSILWLDEGGKVKFMDVRKLEEIGGVWTPLEISMTTKQGKQTRHQTLMRYHNVLYNQDVDRETFTVRHLGAVR